jgi:hypothetical protein
MEIAGTGKALVALRDIRGTPEILVVRGDAGEPRFRPEGEARRAEERRSLPATGNACLSPRLGAACDESRELCIRLREGRPAGRYVTYGPESSHGYIRTLAIPPPKGLLIDIRA